MKKTFSILFATLVVLTSSTSLQAGFSFRKKEKKEAASKKNSSPYPIVVPKGWNCISDAGQLPEKVKVLYVGEGKTQFAPSVNVAVEETNLSLEEYVELAKKYHEQQGETHCSNLGPITTKAGAATVLQIDRKTTWGVVRFLQSSLIKEGKAYVITATCLSDEFVALSPTFIQAIQSFSIES